MPDRQDWRAQEGLGAALGPTGRQAGDRAGKSDAPRPSSGGRIAVGQGGRRPPVYSWRGDSEREGRLARGTSPWKPSVIDTPMSVLAPAVGAVLAAILESSVLTHLQVGGVAPDLVFAVGVAVAMTLGFESGMTWAFVGGVSLDLLVPGRALGSTALTLVLVARRWRCWSRERCGRRGWSSSEARRSCSPSCTRSCCWCCWR